MEGASPYPRSQMTAIINTLDSISKIMRWISQHDDLHFCFRKIYKALLEFCLENSSQKMPCDDLDIKMPRDDLDIINNVLTWR